MSTDIHRGNVDQLIKNNLEDYSKEELIKLFRCYQERVNEYIHETNVRFQTYDALIDELTNKK